MTIEELARVCHNANRDLCRAIGDNSQVVWEDAPEWQRKSAITGVRFRLKYPDAPVSAQHDSWRQEKSNDGWVYGPIKDPSAKTHPCMVAFEELPVEQQAKDQLFIGVVLALCELIPTEIYATL